MERDNIIKALECWASGKPCEGGVCDLFDASTFTCDRWTGKNALALINSQEQRIKELAEERDGFENLAHTAIETQNRMSDTIEELTEENEGLRLGKKELINENEELKNQLQEAISEEDINLFDEFTKLLHEGIREAKANNVSEIKTRFAMRYGTYTDKDMTPITEVFRVLDQIAKEMLEGE